MIVFNKVTWYSRVLALIVFLFVLPAVTFYIGMLYEKVRQSNSIDVPVYVPAQTEPDNTATPGEYKDAELQFTYPATFERTVHDDAFKKIDIRRGDIVFTVSNAPIGFGEDWTNFAGSEKIRTPEGETNISYVESGDTFMIFGSKESAPFYLVFRGTEEQARNEENVAIFRAVLESIVVAG